MGRPIVFLLFQMKMCNSVPRLRNRAMRGAEYKSMVSAGNTPLMLRRVFRPWSDLQSVVVPMPQRYY